MLKKFRERWEAEESSLGKKLKYYGGYLFTVAAWITLHTTDITSLFMNAGVVLPIWLPKVFLACGIISYIVGKCTKKNEECKKEGEGLTT